MNVGRHQAQPARRRFHWRLIPSFIAVAAILASIFYVLSLETNPRISRGSYQQSGILQAESVYQTAARQILQQSVFSRSKLLIDSRSLERQMLERFPELEQASLTIPLTGRRPILYLEPVTPALMLKAGGETYLVDSRGRAVLNVPGPDSYPNLKLSLVQDESGLRVETGHQVLPADDTAFIRQLVYQFAQQHVTIESLILPAAVNELDVRIAGDAYFGKFNLEGDARLQAGTYLAVRDRLRNDGQLPNEYIDVRVEERAFYR